MKLNNLLELANSAGISTLDQAYHKLTYQNVPKCDMEELVNDLNQHGLIDADNRIIPMTIPDVINIINSHNNS